MIDELRKNSLKPAEGNGEREVKFISDEDMKKRADLLAGAVSSEIAQNVHVSPKMIEYVKNKISFSIEERMAADKVDDVAQAGIGGK